jgi:hypothetical protein
MNSSTQETRTFAKRLIAYEALENGLSEVYKPFGFHALEKLHPYLTSLMGSGAFHALLSRSLALATAEALWLSVLEVKADGTLEGLEKLSGQLDTDNFLEGQVVLLAQLFGLLKAFIGEFLTQRLLFDVWPKIPLNHLEFNNGCNNENQK